MNQAAKQRTLKLVQMAILLALVLVLQLWGSGIKIGATSLSLVLIPIVVGGILVGPIGGMILGLFFGVITLMAGVTGTDFFTATLFQNAPFVTAAICLGKGLFAGLFAGLMYKLVSKKSTYGGVFCAAAAAPIVNTGLFILGSLTISDVLAANFVAEGTTVLYFLIIGCAGWNFVLELAVNLLVAPAIFRVVEAVTKKR